MRVRIFANSVFVFSKNRLFAFANFFCLLKYFNLVNFRKFPDSFTSFLFLFLFNNLDLLHFLTLSSTLRNRFYILAVSKNDYKIKNTLAQMDMLLLNHASVTTLPGFVPAFTTFMKMKNERSANFWVENRKRIPKINKLK